MNRHAKMAGALAPADALPTLRVCPARPSSRLGMPSLWTDLLRGSREGETTRRGERRRSRCTLRPCTWRVFGEAVAAAGTGIGERVRVGDGSSGVADQGHSEGATSTSGWDG